MSDKRDLYGHAETLHDTVNQLDDAVRSWEAPTFLESDLVVFAILEEARRNLAVVTQDLVNKLAARMPHGPFVVDGCGTFEKHRKKSRVKWDKDALLSAVLDSILVDRTSGEIIPETPLEKVTGCWNLGVPRTSWLKGRGIDADEFCEINETFGADGQIVPQYSIEFLK